MIAAIADRLTRAVPLVPADVAAVLRPDLVPRIAGRLREYAWNGVVERPPPHFAEEVTPPVGPVFALLATVLEEDDPARWADVLTTAGVDGLLVLLGQRRTPASLTGVDGLPPLREVLMRAARHHVVPGGKLSVAARALDKHAPRSVDGWFWGTASGGDWEKNAAAEQVLAAILDDPTWWNVFGHYRHGTVFEARRPTGHGARWVRGGQVFTGFLEPFEG